MEIYLNFVNLLMCIAFYLNVFKQFYRALSKYNNKYNVIIKIFQILA